MMAGAAKMTGAAKNFRPPDDVGAGAYPIGAPVCSPNIFCNPTDLLTYEATSHPAFYLSGAPGFSNKERTLCIT